VTDAVTQRCLRPAQLTIKPALGVKSAVALTSASRYTSFTIASGWDMHTWILAPVRIPPNKCRPPCLS
jgi:hypothetical protein